MTRTETMARNYIAIDLGATSGRVILATVGPEGLGTETLHRFPTPMLEYSGRYWWNIYTIFDEIVKGLRIAGDRGVKVESIGIDTWGVDFVCVGDDGTFCGLPRAYRDPYTGQYMEKFFRKMPREELYSRTGTQIMGFNTVFQLYAQHKEDCDALDHAHRILFMPDALSYMLTGRMVCEYTTLSTSALMDPRTKKLDGKVLDVCHVKERRFPKIVYPGEKIGRLTPDLAARTGLGEVKVVAVAGHDTASAVAAVPALDKHFAYLSSGTWSLMGIETEEPVINERMYELNFTNEGGVGGTTRLLKNITGMWLLEQCAAKWRAEGREYTYAEMANLAASCGTAARLIDPDDPAFSVPTDMPKAIADWCRAHGFDAPEDDAHMIRLIYDSLAGRYAEVFHKLEGIAPFRIETLHVIGGGSNNAFLNQLTADACGVTVVAGPSEATATGNVMVQAGLSRRDIGRFIETRTFKPKAQQ